MVEVVNIYFDETGNPAVLSYRHVIQQGTLKGTTSTTKEAAMTGGRFILLQFTGLKDRNGKDIYEGDITEYEFPPCGMQRGEWIFDEGAFFLKGTGRWRPLDCEIIGDIYSNPELLTK